MPFHTIEMNIDLNSFEREKAVDATLAAGTIDVEVTNARVVSPIRFNATVYKKAVGIDIAGNITGTVEIDCDRCLESVEQPVDIELDLGFVPKQRLESEANVELHLDDMKVDAIEGSELDLVEIAREQILLDLPQQFFCRDDCKGLCAKCGTNLNLKECDCNDTEIDPRWAALKNLN
jgi:uncharacterized protein